MTARLYGTTRQLYAAVARALAALGLATLGTPTAGALVALYVTGLVLLDERQTQTRVARRLPGRCHDALNRLLRTMPFSTRAVMGALQRAAGRLGRPGYLCVDDVIVEKRWSRALRWAGWAYAWSQKRQVYGLHLVVALWCSSDGRWRVPVAFRLWRPKAACAPRRYRTKPQLAGAMLRELAAARLPADFVVFDTMYTAGWLTKLIGRLGWAWVGTPAPRTTVVWRGERLALRDLAPQLRLKWRSQLGLRAGAARVYAPSFGHLRLVVTRNRHGNRECLVSNDLAADLTTVVRRKRARWSVETLFRDTKQFAGLAACQARVDQAPVRHVALVLLTFAVLQRLRDRPTESLGAVKERWQLAVLRQGEPPPPPLRCCPPALRLTA
jgi:hypothetical protein